MSETEMTDNTILILADELLDHIFTSEASCMYLYVQKFSVDFLDPKEEKFAIECIKFVFDYIHEYGEPPTTAVMVEEFPKYPYRESQHPIEYIVKKFRQRYSFGQISDIQKRIARSAADDALNAQDIGFKEFARLRLQVQDRANEIGSQDWQTWLAEYEKDVLEGRFNGVTMGWPEMNNVLGGYRKGNIYFVLARPKRYKSWLSLMSLVQAQKSGINGVFFNLEMPNKETFGRYGCLATDTSYARWSHGEWLREDYDKYKTKMREIESTFPEAKILKPHVGERSVHSMMEEARHREAEIVYIDQFSFLESPRAHVSDQDWVKWRYVCEDLKNAAIENDIPIVIAAQFNREAANLSEMADLSKIGLADAIGQFADMLLGVHQTKDMRASRIMEFGTVDSRGFQPASWHFHVRFDDQCDIKLIERVT